MLLAIIAIIYSFYSNSSISQNISILGGLSQQVAQSAEKIRLSTDEIVQQAKSLPSHLVTVEGKVEETKSLIKEFYGKQSAPEVPSKQPDPSLISAKLADSFLAISSESGLLVVYACHLVLASSKKTLNLRKLCEETKVSEFRYMYGFAVASMAAGIIVGSGEDFTITVMSMNDRVSSKIKETLMERLSRDSEQEGKKLKQLSALEEFVSNGAA